MMRALLLGVFMISFYSINAQKFFTGNGDYSVLVNGNVNVKHVETENGGFIDSYILREDGVFLYMISITKVKPPGLTSETIYSEGYKQSYLTECSCELLESKKIEARNFNGIKFTILAELNGSRIKGFSVSTVSSGTLFTVNFLTEEKRFDSFIGEYEKIINSFMFR